MTPLLIWSQMIGWFSVRVVPANGSDLGFISAVMMRRWDMAREPAVADSRKYVDRQEGKAAFVARLRGRVVGCGLFDPRNDDVSCQFSPWLMLLWVEPRYRNRGIGWQLSLARFEFARRAGYTAVYLDTEASEPYHLRRGWTRIGSADWHGEPVSLLRYELAATAKPS